MQKDQISPINLKDKSRMSKHTSLETVYKRVLEVFDYDKDKAIAWYLTKQINLGNLSPYELCKAGKARTVLTILNRTLHA